MDDDDSNTIYMPSDMLADFKNISVVADGNHVSVSINCYKNADHTDSAGCKDALVIKDNLIQLGSASVLGRCGGGQAYVDVFTGKGSPEGIAAVLATLADYSDQFIRRYKGAGGPTKKVVDWLSDDSLGWGETLQNVCDAFLGLDCNGFVGNWLRKCDYTLRIGPNTRIKDILAARKVARMSIDQIQYADVIVWTNLSHVAAVDDVSGGGIPKFNICQSAGGGPRINEFVVNQSSPGTFTLLGSSEWATKNVPGPVQIFNLWPE
jgi:hypothetical protein